MIWLNHAGAFGISSDGVKGSTHPHSHVTSAASIGNPFGPSNDFSTSIVSFSGNSVLHELQRIVIVLLTPCHV
jgi:hypothetical protein